MSDKGIIVIYNTESNGTKVEVRLIDGNLWLTQEQIVSLYNSSKSNISEHIKHILEEGELDENSVVRNFRTTASDGKQYNVKHYNLEMILAIGYRVRSNVGTNFRKWATSTLKEYVTKGFALNDKGKIKITSSGNITFTNLGNGFMIKPERRASRYEPIARARTEGPKKHQSLPHNQIALDT